MITLLSIIRLPDCINLLYGCLLGIDIRTMSGLVWEQVCGRHIGLATRCKGETFHVFKAKLTSEQHFLFLLPGFVRPFELFQDEESDDGMRPNTQKQRNPSFPQTQQSFFCNSFSGTING